MKVPIQIRKYIKDDKTTLLHLLELNTPQYFAVEEKSDFEHYLDNEIDNYFVVVYQSTIVGCGGINFFEDKTIGRISWDIVHPDYQGKSIGKQLLEFRIEKLKTEKNLQKIIVRTSQVAYSFYRKFGFEVVEIVADYWAEGFDLYLMEYQNLK